MIIVSTVGYGLMRASHKIGKSVYDWRVRRVDAKIEQLCAEERRLNKILSTEFNSIMQEGAEELSPFFYDSQDLYGKVLNGLKKSITQSQNLLERVHAN